MKKLYCVWIGMIIALGGCGTADVWGIFKASVAVRVVTPDPLLPVSGGVGPSKPTSKKYGELTVRALVLENDGVRVAICSTDFLGFPGVLCERVRKLAKGIPADHILIGATHSHSGPDCYGFPDAQGRTSVDLKYLDWVCRQLADAINEAIAKLRPARLKIATGEAQGKIAYNYYAEALFDPRCEVLQVLDVDGSAIATLVNYACHPEVIGSEQGILCPDFVGPLYDRIAAQGGGVGVYMNGALGGMVTADCRREGGREEQTWRECKRIGSLLADEALRIVAKAAVQNDPQLYCASKWVLFPVESPLLRAVVQASPLGYDISDLNELRALVNVVNVGNAQMLTIPGEALPNIGFYLKRKMHGEHNFLLGLTNEAFGYILAKEDWNSFERYDYISRICLGELTGEIFEREALALVNACPKPVLR